MQQFLRFFWVLGIAISCTSKPTPLDETAFKGKTFLFYNPADSASFYVDFKDSICNEINYDSRNYPWKLKTYEGNDFLIVGEAVYGIKKNEKANTFTLTALDYKDRSLTISEVEPKWDEEKLYGTWINEEADSTDREMSLKLPLLDPPIATYKIVWPPEYRIEKDTIYSYDLDKRSKSKYTLSHSHTFMQMHLDKPTLFQYNYQWEVTLVNDSIMELNCKSYQEMKPLDESFTEEKIVLKKKKE